MTKMSSGHLISADFATSINQTKPQQVAREDKNSPLKYNSAHVPGKV